MTNQHRHVLSLACAPFTLVLAASQGASLAPAADIIGSEAYRQMVKFAGRIVDTHLLESWNRGHPLICLRIRTMGTHLHATQPVYPAGLFGEKSGCPHSPCQFCFRSSL